MPFSGIGSVNAAPPNTATLAVHRAMKQTKQTTPHFFGAFPFVISCPLVLMFPVSKSGFAPKGNVDRWGTEKPLFSLQLQSLTDSSKKKERKESFRSQTHFHLASCFLSDGGKWVNVIPFLMVEQANLLTPPGIVD